MDSERKEIWVDSRTENLEELAIKLGATGIHGRSERGVKTLPENSKEVVIRSQADIEALTKYLNKVPYIVAKCPGWKMIPAENIVAKSQGSNTKVIIATNDIREAMGYAGALERGVDGFLVSDPSVIERFCSLYQSSWMLRLVDAEVTEVKLKKSKGPRMCVDTSDSFNQREGLLVGYRPYFMLLADAETMENPYVNTRDFRVNAGSISLYTLAVGERGFGPKYLNDFKARDEICNEFLAVNAEGNTRIVDCARVKIEWRPMIYIKAEYVEEKDGGVERHSGVMCSQYAETVRLVSPDGSIPVTKIKPGDYLKAYVPEPVATHFGQVVEERIIER